MHKLKIYILGGGISKEREVSLKTANTFFENIDKNKYEPIMIEINRLGDWIVKNVPLRSSSFAGLTSLQTKQNKLKQWLEKNKPDVILLGLHGTGYEDGQIQQWLDKLDIKYTGSGAKASKLAFNKERCKKLFAKEGLLVPKGVLIKKGQFKEVEKLIKGLKYPLFVKPNQNGSSVATTRLTSSSGLKKALDEVWMLDDTALVEQEIKGRELSCGVIQSGDMGLALPPTEIKPKTGFFDYDAKYIAGESQEITPAQLSQDEIEQVQAIATICHESLGCRGITRTDIIRTKNKKTSFFVLEINTLPGMTETSLVPQQAKATGLTISNLIDLLIEDALTSSRK